MLELQSPELAWLPTVCATNVVLPQEAKFQEARKAMIKVVNWQVRLVLGFTEDQGAPQTAMQDKGGIAVGWAW